MKIIPYKLAETKEILTCRAGMLCLAELMQQISLTELADNYLPLPGSNRGFKPSEFLSIFMLMLHNDAKCLEDIRHLKQDGALRALLGLKSLPTAVSLGNWLRRMGQAGVLGIESINRHLLSLALHQRKSVTLDIDATLCASNKRDAKWSYQNTKGYMPMLGFIEETGQVVCSDFRSGNTAPAANNLAFIQRCESALPQEVKLKLLRIDAAGYQADILNYCEQHGIGFAIRSKMYASLKAMVLNPSLQWKPMLNRDGQVADGEEVCRFVDQMQNANQMHTVVVQRKVIVGKQLDLLAESDSAAVEIYEHKGYLYRAIATNRTEMSDSNLIHWYNQRGEHAENKIRALKEDFNIAKLPCGDFNANAFYFSLVTLAYNLFVLLKYCVPTELESAKAKTIRWRLYAVAAKLTQHARQVTLKIQKGFIHLVQETIKMIRANFPTPET